MGKNTKISWCDDTFNPWRGCTKVSPGCANCYAEAMDKRFGGDRWGLGKARERTSAANWREPLKWNHESAQDRWSLPLNEQAGASNRRVFCASMADWLDPEVSAQWLADLLDLIAATPHLDWLLLTKRPELWQSRMREAWAQASFVGLGMLEAWLNGQAPANVWVGATVEDQQRADLRIPALLSIPARVRFLSCEPLLERVLLDNGDTSWLSCRGGCSEDRDDAECCGSFNNVGKCFHGIDWVICGGESGSKARPFDLAWARSLRDQCTSAGVPFLMKQLGDNPVARCAGCPDCGTNRSGGVPTIKTHHGADPAEWPADLRVQQFPTVRGAA